MASAQREIDFEELSGLLGKSIVIIDVRETHEIANDGKIPTSINVPLGDLKEALQQPSDEFLKLYNAKKPALDEKIVFHCRGGKRAAMANDVATNLGYNNAITYKGSFADWLAKGGKVERN